MSANLRFISNPDTFRRNQFVAELSKNSGGSQEQGSAEKVHVDSLRGLEMQLKEIWSQYISYLDQNGFDETARSLKSKYFGLYQNYQKNKNWRNIVTNN